MATQPDAATTNCDQVPADVKHCDLCDGEHFDIVSRLDRKREPLASVVCTRCGLVVHGRIPSDDELTEFYTTQYRQDYHGETSPSARRVVRAWRNGRRIFQQLEPSLRTADQVFEVGAGIGCNVKAFELAGYEASGIDPGVGFQEFAKTKLHAKIENATLFDLPREANYDLVLLIHVIEHLRSPRRALEFIYQMLRPGGRLYVECPNLLAPFARHSRLFHFAHIHNFTPQTLTMMAGRCGFQVAQTFSDDHDPNLQVLLSRSEASRLQVDPNAYHRTMDALRRSGSLPYFARVSYYRRRAKQLVGYAGEHLTAKRQVRQIVEQCGSSADCTRSPRDGDAGSVGSRSAA